MSTIAQRLVELGVTLPTPAAPVGAYVGWARTGDLVFTSGQLPMLDGKLQLTGKLGAPVTVEQAYAAARLVGINILAQVAAAVDGDLERIVRCVKLVGFVACVPEFAEHPKVINGASEFMVAVLGEAGRHARSAVGVPSLPLDAAVEIEGVFEVR